MTYGKEEKAERVVLYNINKKKENAYETCACRTEQNGC